MGMLGYSEHEIPPPKFGKTALELLSDPVADPPSLASAYGVQFSFGLIGATTQYLKNWAYRRPLYSGVHFFPIYFVAGFTFSHYFLQWRRNYWAERDAVLRHYVQLHPEDFPPPERKKYKDVVIEWIPCR